MARIDHVHLDGRQRPIGKEPDEALRLDVGSAKVSRHTTDANAPGDKPMDHANVVHAQPRLRQDLLNLALLVPEGPAAWLPIGAGQLDCVMFLQCFEVDGEPRLRR